MRGANLQQDLINVKETMDQENPLYIFLARRSYSIHATNTFAPSINPVCERVTKLTQKNVI